MSLNRFSIWMAAALFAIFVAGVSSGLYFNSALYAAAAAFLLPTAILLLFGGGIGRAWWSANRQETLKTSFGNEAKQSLRFVVWITAALSIVVGVTAYRQNSVYEGAFAGLLLAMTVFGFMRLRDVDARKLS